MKFNIILITDSNCGISRYNKMPWFFQEDLHVFNEKTEDAVCIMGSVTARDYGKTLKGRENIVISSKDDLDPGFTVVRTFADALKKAATYPLKDVFVIGGARLFNEALKSAALDTIYYTHIDAAFHCDNFVEPILGRADMVYEITNRVQARSTSIYSAVDTSQDVLLTFYTIRRAPSA